MEFIVHNILIIQIFFLGGGVFLSWKLWQRWSNVFLRGIMLICWGLLLWGYIIEPYRLVVREFDVVIPEIEAQNMVIVSDIHVRQGKGQRWVQKLVNKINALENIDKVVIPGDFLFGSPEHLLKELEPLQDLRVPTFFTLGNHDHSLNHEVLPTENTIDFFTSLGLIDLNNTSAESAYGWLSGLDDNYLGYGKLEAIEKGKEDILLAHSPDIVDEIGAGYDPKLIITGHTHCGQIRFPWLGSVPGLIPTRNGKKYERHLYEYKEGRFLFVTCGAGEVGPSARLFNPPEIVVLRVN